MSNQPKIDAKVIYEQIVHQTLNRFYEPRLNMRQLIMGTIGHESHMGKYTEQVGGPALGICQMEPATFKDLIVNYITGTRADSMMRVFGKPETWTKERLIWDWAFAVGMCFMHYRRVPARMPEDNDWDGLAMYYKKWYNSNLGKATPQDFLDAVERYNVKSIIAFDKIDRVKEEWETKWSTKGL